MRRVKRKKRPLAGKPRTRRNDLTLKKLVAKITPGNRYAEIPVGAEIGREVIEW